MQKWKEDLLLLCKNKLYVWMLGLTAVCCYGFLITHGTVGIDDTPYAYYFEEGLNVIVGRWFLFLWNKVFHISEFAPFVTDFAGVLILMAAVTAWCVLLYSICGDRAPIWGYAFFSCIFLSCPLIGEVYTYHLHNGVSVGYLCTGVSLCCFRELSRKPGRNRKTGLLALLTAFLLFIALGCYESFMVVWLLGLFLVLLTERYAGIRCKVFPLLFLGLAAAVLAIGLRSVMVAGVIGLFGLGDMQGEAVRRSIMDAVSWIFGPEAFAEFGMAVKRVYVMYFAFAYAYYPIRIFVAAAAIMAAGGLYGMVRRKDGWLPILTLGCFSVPLLLVLVEGKATLYRSAQFLPVICGYGAFLASYAAAGLRRIPFPYAQDREKEGPHGIRKRKGGLWMPVCRIGSGMVVFGLCATLWNQCHDLNRWFYVDWLKYQAALDYMKQIDRELEQNYDTSKPIVFTGAYQPPKSVISDAYVGYGTETFYKISRLTGVLDEHLLEKYYRGEYGVWVAQTPALSVIDWGMNAFGNDAELTRFLAMHGYSLKANMDAEIFEEANVRSMDWPHFPARGSIVDMGDYIIVHF